MRKYQIVTIERQYASGGRRVGELVAKQLGIPFYSERILELAARELGVDKGYLIHAEERVTKSLLYNLAMSVTAGFVEEKGMPLTQKVFLTESKLIKKFAAEGSCVLVGRCADYVLKDRKDCLKVFIHAERKDRIQRAVNEYQIAENTVESILNGHDKRRASFYFNNSGNKWGEKEYYDLCLNSSTLGIETCADLIAGLCSKDSGKDRTC